MLMMKSANAVTLLVAFIFSAAAHEARDCIHGFSLPDGTCDCYSCWTGDSCSIYASRRPVFERSFDTTAFTPTDDNMEGKFIYKAVASDPDEEFCKEPGGCACSNVTYFIATQDQFPNFQIDKYTGAVTLNTDNYFSPHSDGTVHLTLDDNDSEARVLTFLPLGYINDHQLAALTPSSRRNLRLLAREYELIIGASDDGPEYNTMTLVVQTGNRWDGASPNKYFLDMADDMRSSNAILDYSSRSDDQPLSRHKRDVTLPGNVTFNLSKFGPTENATEIKVGIRIQFKLDIVFPKGSTDIQVELFAPDPDIMVMMLCNVQVTRGSNLAVSGSVEPSMEPINTERYDRAIIKLDTVSNNENDLTTLSPSTMSITYEAVMVESDAKDNEEYWVSAGAAYNGETDVWVGQASFTAKTADDSSNFTDTPVVRLTGTDALAIGSCANYNLNITLNRPVVGLKFDMFAPRNLTDIMSICMAKVVSVNNAYQCGMRQMWDYVPTYTQNGSPPGYSHAHIDLGRPINKLAREYDSKTPGTNNGVITLGLQVCMKDDPSLVDTIKKYRLASAVSIGATIIWAGQIDVTATSKATSQHVTPTFNMSFPSGSGIRRSKPVTVRLDMEVPENTIADYLLEVMAPIKNGQAVFQVCTVRMVFAGENMACLSQRKFDVDYIISSNSSSSMYPDVAKLNLGTISNLGTMGWTHSNFSDNKNTVSFEILFQVNDHPAATVGSVHDIYFGMFVGTDKLTIGKINMTVEADTPATPSTVTNAPQVNISLGGDGSSKLYLDKSSQVLLDIKTVRNTIYSPFNIEVIMPNNSGQAMIRICKVKVQSVGVNNPCVIAEGVDRSVQLISSFSDGVTDRAIINMASLCNVQQVDDQAEDHVVFVASVVLRRHQQFTTNSSTSISAGVLSNTVVQVVVMSVQADVNGNPVSVSGTPYLAIVPNNGNLTSIPLGYPARYLVRIKMSPNDSTPMTVNISTVDNALSLCSVRFVRAGDAYPCLEPADGILANEDQQLGIYKSGSIDLAYVTNMGSDNLVPNDQWDTNTIELEVVAKVSLNSAHVPDGSTHNLKIVLYYNQGYSSQVSATGTVTTTQDTSAVNHSTVASSGIQGAMNVTSITELEELLSTEKLDTIVKSESKRIVVTLNTLINTTSQLTVTVTTPTNINDVMEVLYVGLLDSGENLPCVKAGQTKATYQPRQSGGAYKDFGILDLGYVCNVGTITNDTTGTANRIRIESIVRLLGSAKVSPGNTLQVHGAITSNRQEMLVYSVSLTVADDAVFTDIYRDNLNDSAGIDLNLTEKPIIVGISKMKTFPLVITVPPFTSSRVNLDAVMPVNTSAIMTVITARIVDSGRNLPNVVKYQDYSTITQSSRYNTSQVTKYEMNLGVISNSGVTYRNGQNMTDDDTFTVEFTLQMADNKLAIDQSEHQVSFGLRVANFIFLLNVMVTVSRTGNEILAFNVSCAVNHSVSTPNQIQIDTILSLSSQSMAEGRESILNIFLPVYVTYMQTTLTSPYKTINRVDNINNSVTLSIGPLFFTDEVHLTTVIASSPHPVPLGITGQDSVFTVQPIADTSTSTDVAGNLDYVNFTVATTPQGSPECGLAPLGMESGSIMDCQISSSTDSIVGSEANQGRYNTGTGWSPFVHTGKVREERFFQVYFGSQVMVTQIKIQQLGPAYATQLRLRYSNDGLAWVESTTMLTPTAGIADQTLDVPSAQSSRYLRVMVSALNDEKQKGTFRFEFIGCLTVNDSPTDVCLAVIKYSPRLPDFSRRSFIHAGGAIYVCDGIQGTKGIEQKCYASTDDRTWRVLDGRVGCLLGYDSLEPRLYAVSANGQSYMSSLDGLEWFSVADTLIMKAKGLPTYKSAVTVPVDGNVKLNSATPDSTFTDSNYGATVDGLMVNQAGWSTIFTWSACCP